MVQVKYKYIVTAFVIHRSHYQREHNPAESFEVSRDAVGVNESF